AVLEAHAAARAATRITEAELERMQELASQMEHLSEEPRASRDEEARLLVQYNQEFHEIVIKASRNPHLDKLVRRTVEVPLVFKSFFWYGPQERAISNYYHRQILRALDRKSTRLNSSHVKISYAVFCLKKKTKRRHGPTTN